MTVGELIKELEKFSPTRKLIGWRLNRFSEKPDVYETQVKINDDGTIEFFDDRLHLKGEATTCVIIDF